MNTMIVLWIVSALITGPYFILRQRRVYGSIYGGYILLYSFSAIALGPYLLAGLFIQWPLLKFLKHKF